jgi:hypothetical protein
MHRRSVLAAGGAAGAALIAGCTGGGETEPATDDKNVESGMFRLLVTDLPADIGDFDSLEVTLDEARVFPGEEEEEEEDDEEDDEDGENGGEETAETDDENSDEDVENGEEDEEEADDEESEEDDDQDFFYIDLDSATVDLTQVVGDKAMAVFEGELDAGKYSKVELYAEDIVGMVDGEEVDVKIPSGKLQIVHGFEVRAEETTTFVFDIHVVRKGNGGYNLRPVISGSGVNGEDVDVEEVDDEDEEDDEADEGDGDNQDTESGSDGADEDSSSDS